eukprot:3166532-Prymnesium_polylepis.1
MLPHNLRLVERALGAAMSAAMPELDRAPSGEQGAARALRSIAASLVAQAADIEGAAGGETVSRELATPSRSSISPTVGGACGREISATGLIQQLADAKNNLSRLRGELEETLSWVWSAFQTAHV